MTDKKTQTPMMLLSTMVDKNYNILLKFYNPDDGTIILRRDATFNEYCYADPAYPKLGEVSEERQRAVVKIDPVTDKKRMMTQAYVRGYSFAREDKTVMEKTTTGNYIPKVDLDGNTVMEQRQSDIVWESDIKSYESYLHDKDLAVGMHYDISGKPRRVLMAVPENVTKELKNMLETKESGQFKEHLSEWAETLSQPIPYIRRVAIDIEISVTKKQSIESVIASGTHVITAISFKGDGIDKVFVLDENCNDDRKPQAMENFDLIRYSKETDMLQDTFKIMEEYPVILTYNGAGFDLPYMEVRAKVLGIITESKKDIPFFTRKSSNNIGQTTYSTTFRKSIHVDLYNIMDNKAFQIYVFGNKYTKKGLDDVSKAILGYGKLEHDLFGEKQDVEQLAKYCYHDSLLTYNLTAHDGNMLMNMLVIVSRISRLPLDDVARYKVSQWIRGRFYYNHRKNNLLIPNRADLKKRSIGMNDDAITKGKKYIGGFVIKPDPGLYFNVVVVDFASLYPSIIKSYNISYETVRCPHKECETNMIPGTNHWCCIKKYGMTSLIIGSLRDLRVDYYKRLSNDKSLPEQTREQYGTVAQALKVILNAAYGVLGADTFSLYYPPAAEAVTTIGRNIIQGCVKICEENNAKVLYGDSVPGDTPIVCERNGVKQIVPIKSLITSTIKNGRQKHSTLKVLSDDGFVDVKYSYIHKVRKIGYRIGTRKAYVEATDDHSLVVNGKEVKPHQLKLGDKIDITDGHVFGNDTIIQKDIAWLFGFYLSDGTLETYGPKKSWKIVKNDKTKLEKAQRIMSECLGFNTSIYSYPSEDKMHTLAPINNCMSAIVEYFKLHCYSNDTKIVPSCILGGTIQVKESFMQGMIDGDSHIDKKDHSITFGQIHKSILAGYIYVITALGHDYSLKFRKDKSNYISVRIIGDANDSRVRDADMIVLLEKFEIDEYVYDLSTHNEHFRGGLGNVLLHNTDSVFLHAPTQEQIDSIILQAKEKHKVDLEVDKTYKFCVFSDRKKNYYGLLDTGKMDIKGLAGKKSNTPQFAKDLFANVIETLKTIESKEDVDPILEKITQMIVKCAFDIRHGNIPLKAMSFTSMLGGKLEDYSVRLEQKDINHDSLTIRDSATKIEKPLEPGRHKLKEAFNPDGIKSPVDINIYSRLPLHVKAALWLCNDVSTGSNDVKTIKRKIDRAEKMIAGTNIKKGEPVTYVKMTEPVKALPLKMFGENDNASMEWIVPETFNATLEQCEIAFGKKICMVDVEKYIALVTSILNPILEPLGLEFEEKRGTSVKKTKPAQTGSNLDVFLS